MDISLIPTPALSLILQHLSADKSCLNFRQVCRSWNEKFLSCAKLILSVTHVQFFYQEKFRIDFGHISTPKTVHNSNFSFDQFTNSPLFNCISQVDLVVETRLGANPNNLQSTALVEFLQSLSEVLQKRVDFRIRVGNATVCGLIAAVSDTFQHFPNLQLSYLSVGAIDMENCKNDFSVLKVFGKTMRNFMFSHLQHFDISFDWFDLILHFNRCPADYADWSDKVTSTSVMVLSRKNSGKTPLLAHYSTIFPNLKRLEIVVNRGDLDLQLLNKFAKLSELELTVTCSSDVEVSRLFHRFSLPTVCPTVEKFIFTLDFPYEMQREMAKWPILLSFPNLTTLRLKLTSSKSILDSFSGGQFGNLKVVNVDLSCWQHFGDNLAVVRAKTEAFGRENFESLTSLLNLSAQLNSLSFTSTTSGGIESFSLLENCLKSPKLSRYEGQLKFSAVDEIFQDNTILNTLRQICLLAHNSTVKLVVLHCDAVDYIASGKLNNLAGVLSSLSTDSSLNSSGLHNFSYSLGVTPRNRQSLTVGLKWHRRNPKDICTVRLYIKL